MPNRTSLRSLAGLLSHFRVLITLLVVVVLLVTALAFMVSTRLEVTQAMLAAGDESARNVLRVVKLNIRTDYDSLEAFKQYAMARYKDQLKNLMDVVVSQIDFFYDMQERGILSSEQATAMVLQAVERARYGKNDYFFIYDSHNVAVSHPDPAVRGRDMLNFRDVNGNLVLPTMREALKSTGNGFCTMWWLRLGETAPVPKLIYFHYYPRNDWLIGTGVYIDDIDSDVQKMMARTMDNLKETFDQVKVSKTGYFFVVSGDDKILIHPTLAGTDGNSFKDAMTGESHFALLEKASRNPSLPFKYIWDKPEYPGQFRFVKYSHVEHFEPFNWYIGSSVYEDEMAEPGNRIVHHQMIVVGIIVALCVACASFLVSRMTRPLARLARHTDRLRESDFSLPQGESDELLSMRFPGEVGRLAHTIWKMEQKLREYLAHIRETTAARERIESELRIARDIQMSMLPEGLSAGERGLGVDLAAVLEPARDVGGDFYDFFFIDDERLCLVIGDVADKGVPAALFMARSMALLRNTATTHLQAPDAVLTTVSRDIAKANDACMFLTVFLGILHVKTGEFVFSNAGHLPPLFLPAAGACRTIELPRGMPMGLSTKAVYSTGRFLLGPGDGLLLFTDGITEAADAGGTFYGAERLEALMNEHPTSNAGETVERISREVTAFTGEAPRSDDMALLCVRLTGTVSSPLEFAFSIRSDISKTIPALDEMERFAMLHNIPDEIVFDFRLAMEEALCNIITHGMEKEGEGESIEIGMRVMNGIFQVTITDPGRPFNPLELAEVDMDRYKATKQVGGLGVHLLRRLVRDLGYEYRDGLNVLTLSRKLNG